jgi:ribosomal protein L32
MKKVSILTVSYDKDLEWLKYQKQSFDKFCSGYHSYAVVSYPEDNERLQKWLNDKRISSFTSNHSKNIKRGYMKQQIIKLHADEFCGDADYIMHVDSDCVFHTPNTPQDFFVDNKPIMLRTRYDGPSLKNNQARCWQKVTEAAMKEVVEFEYMRRLPLIYPIGFYKAARDWFKNIHGKSVAEYIKDGNNLSEFNLMGAYCDKFLNEDFHWIDTDISAPPKQVLRQFWSYGGVSKNEKEIDKLLYNKTNQKQ